MLVRLGKGEKYIDWKSPEHAREMFEKQWEQCLRQERTVDWTNGIQKTLVVYEIQIDAKDSNGRNDVITRFCLDAAQAGYTELLSPVVVPGTFRNETQEGCSIYFSFVKPAAVSEERICW